MPHLPDSPWPPPYPGDWNRLTDRDEAARIAFWTSNITVAPSSGDGPPEATARCDDFECSAFWLPQQDYSELTADLDRILATTGNVRLAAAEGTPLGAAHVLPRSRLSDHARRMLGGDHWVET
ncbi:MAG: hypothetical protein AB1758_06895 [Candidatus Eremiobacterota bacterium]